MVNHKILGSVTSGEIPDFPPPNWGVYAWKEIKMTGNYKDVPEEDAEFFNKVGKLDPLFFCRGYSQEEMNKILKENGIFKKDMGKGNTKSAQEVQQEQCKDKTILEMIEGRKK